MTAYLYRWRASAWKRPATPAGCCSSAATRAGSGLGPLQVPLQQTLVNRTNRKNPTKKPHQTNIKADIIVCMNLTACSAIGPTSVSSSKLNYHQCWRYWCIQFLRSALDFHLQQKIPIFSSSPSDGHPGHILNTWTNTDHYIDSFGFPSKTNSSGKASGTARWSSLRVCI